MSWDYHGHALTEDQLDWHLIADCYPETACGDQMTWWVSNLDRQHDDRDHCTRCWPSGCSWPT
jgi:hypothetical protein